MNLLNHNISGYLFTLFAVIVIYVLISRQLNSKFSDINSVILSNTNDIKKDFKKDIKKLVRHDIDENVTDIIHKYVVDEIKTQNKNNMTNSSDKLDEFDELDDGLDELDDDGLDELDDDGLDELDNDGLDELDNDGLGELDNDGLDELDDDGLDAPYKTLNMLEQIEDVDDTVTHTDANTECKIIEIDDTDETLTDIKTTPTIIENNVTIKKTTEEPFVLDDISIDTLKVYPYNKLNVPELREIVRKFSLSKNPKNTKKKDLLELINIFVNSQ
jgi:hypothetical protein